MRVTIDIRLLGRGGRSGIEEYTEELVSRLIMAPHQFNLFYNGRKMAPLPVAFARENVIVANWGLPNKLVDASMRFFGKPQIQSDVFFSPHFNFIKTSAPRVITFHDLSFAHHPRFFSWKQRLWHHWQGWREQARKAAHIIAVSEFTKLDLVEVTHIPPEKITVIYPGINPAIKLFPKDDPGLEAWSIHRELAHKPFILYLGTLEPRKNIPALIRAFNILHSRASFHDLELVLAGAPGWLYQEILHEIAASPAKDAIRVLGAVAPEERVFLYNKCRAFVYPSFFEGFGFPPLEAQACGAPVVAGNRTSLAETLGSSALLIDPWRIGDLAENIAECLENKGLRAKLIAAGRANAARFNWETAATKTLEILELASKTKP